MPLSASSRSTAGFGASAAFSPSPRARVAWASSACSARPSRRPRRRSPASSPLPSPISPIRSRTFGASSSRTRSCRRAPTTRRPSQTLPTSADRSAPAARSRSRPPAPTTCCSSARREPGRRCSARRLPGLLPPLDLEAALEVTRIHSVAGLLPPEQPLVERPPFRAPHHSASTAAVVGGGQGIRPGEASLAHRGVLLLDELAEFARPTLEALRQPLEDGVVSIARAAGRAIFPARFLLIGTMNMCPCGARGDAELQCTCSTQRLNAYRDKLSHALLDRFDLVVMMPRPRAAELAAGPAEPSAPVAARCAAARERPDARRTTAADTLLSNAVERLPLSGRGRARVARTARTIAALAQSDTVESEHIAEALAYRSPRELAA